MTLHLQALCNEPNIQTTASMINGLSGNSPMYYPQLITLRTKLGPQLSATFLINNNN